MLKPHLTRFDSGPFEADEFRTVVARVNEAIEETGVAAGVLGHPANGVAWLANKLARYDEILPPGQVILSGSFTRPVFAGAGDVIHADFGDLGAVTCRFR